MHRIRCCPHALAPRADKRRSRLRAPQVDTTRSLEEALLDFAGCVVVVSHDRYFLDRLCTHILAAEGDAKWVWFEGNCAHLLIG